MLFCVSFNHWNSELGRICVSSEMINVFCISDIKQYFFVSPAADQDRGRYGGRCGTFLVEQNQVGVPEAPVRLLREPQVPTEDGEPQ